MIRLDTYITSQIGPNSLNSQKRSEADTEQVTVKSSLSSYQYTRSDEKSFVMFQRTVHQRLEQSIGDKFPSDTLSAEEFAAHQREERADKAAGNILKFIELRLNKDVKDGASDEQLGSRIEAALKGFEQGYDEANQVLKDMNLLNDEVEADISLTQEKVLAGIEALKTQYLNDGADTATQPISSEKVDSQQLDVPDISTTRSNIGESLTNYSAIQVGEARDFSFQLETADGDIVTINASSLMAYQAEAGQQTNTTEFGNTTSRYLSESGVQSERFAFSVEGELDEGELKAINDILNSVGDLAADFYAGDVGVAFEKALNMGFDSSEISAFAFSMTHVTQVKAIQAYSPEQEILKPNVLSELRPIGKFASELARSLAVAKEYFAQPADLIGSMIEQMDADTKDTLKDGQMSFTEFSQSLLDKFEALEFANQQRDGGEVDSNL